MTEQEAELRTLRESAARFRAVLDAARDFAVVGLDPSGIVTDMSAGAERVLGWNEKDLVGRYFGAFFTEADNRAEVPRNEMERARAHGRALNERWHCRQDGSVFWGSGYCYPVEGGGFVKVFQDRTIEMRAEAELHNTLAELRQANADLEAFGYSVSHDIRAPLRAIASTSAIVLEEWGDRIGPEGREYLTRQQQAAKRLSSLMESLLALSRIGRAETEIADADLGAIAREAIESLGQACARSEITVPDSIPIRGDARLLSLLMQNLLENACKFSAGGRVEVGEARDGDESRYYVRDDGIGFDMAQAERLFLPFERLVSDDEYPGTGVGLANVKRIAERHGGRAWAESAPGEGATFWFTLA